MRRRENENEIPRVKVGDVAVAVRCYAGLGLRVLRQSSRRALLELPSGLHVVIYQTVSRTALPARG